MIVHFTEVVCFWEGLSPLILYSSPIHKPASMPYSTLQKQKAVSNFCQAIVCTHFKLSAQHACIAIQSYQVSSIYLDKSPRSAIL